MIVGRGFSFLKNIFIFLIDRLYKEWVHMYGNGRIYSEGASERGDLYAKQLIETIIHNRDRKYDPFTVDGISAIYYGPIGVILREAKVTGLSRLHRTYKCFLTDIKNRAFINGTFGAGPLIYQREIVFRFGDLKRKIMILVSLMDIKVSVDFSIDKETGRNGFLLNFAVDELNGFNLNINGFGYFDWIINLVLNFFARVLGRIVRNLLEKELEQHILNMLPKYQFPVEVSSCRNETKFNVSPEDVPKKEESLSKTFYMKQNCKIPKWSRISPVAKKRMNDVGKGYNSLEYGTEKELVSNLENTKTSRSFVQTNNQTTEVNIFCFPEQSLGLFSGSLLNNSCNEVSEDKYEENSDRLSALSKETLNESRSLKGIKEKLVSISPVTNFSSQGITSKNRLENASPSFNSSIPVELNDISETESNSTKSTDSTTSSPAKGIGLKSPQKASILVCEEQESTEKESKMEYSSHLLQDSCRDLVEIASKDSPGTAGQSDRLDDIFSEIHELSCRKNVDANALDTVILLPSCVDNYDSSPPTKTELPQIDANVLEREAETPCAEGGTFLDPSPKRDLKMFIADISDDPNERTEDLNQNVLAESCTHYQSPEVDVSVPNRDFKICNAEMFQNDLLNPCKDEEITKDLKPFKVLRPENKTQIDDYESIKSYTKMLFGNQSVEIPETRCVFDLEHEVEGQNKLNSDIVSDSMELAMIQDVKDFDSESGTEIISKNLQFNEKHEDEVNGKIKLKHTELYIGTIELNKDSRNKTDVGYIPDSARDSEKMNTSNFQNKDVAHNKLLERLAVLLNENGTEGTDCLAELSSILKSNTDSHTNGLEEPIDQDAFRNIIRKIISKIFKPKCNVESESEDNEYPRSFQVSRYGNLEFETKGLGQDEVSRLLQNDSKINDLEVSCLQRGDQPSLSLTESDIKMTEFVSSDKNELKHESVMLIEKLTDSFAAEFGMRKSTGNEYAGRF